MRIEQIVASNEMFIIRNIIGARAVVSPVSNPDVYTVKSLDNLVDPPLTPEQALDGVAKFNGNEMSSFLAYLSGVLADTPEQALDGVAKFNGNEMSSFLAYLSGVLRRATDTDNIIPTMVIRPYSDTARPNVLSRHSLLALQSTITQALGRED
jgi:hypothetical protein